MLKRVLVSCVACLLLASPALKAQIKQVVFVLPGGTSNVGNVTALGTNPLSQISTFQAGVGSFLLFGEPDNSRFYVVATSLTQTVTSVSSTFQTPQNILSLAAPALAAAMTPDGTRLAVVNGNSVHIINTTTNTDIVSSGINVGSGVKVFDVAVSLDGKTFFTLGTTSSGSQLNSIDVASTTVTGTLAISGTASGLAVGPNDLVYVSAPNLVEEINPNTLQVTPSGSITMNATPGPLAFTPDGQYAMAANETPLTGSDAVLISLANHAVTSTVPNFGIILTSLQAIATNQILAYSTENNTAYVFTIGAGGTITEAQLPVPGAAQATTALATSNEVPGGTVTSVQSIFAVNSGTVYQLNGSTYQSLGLSPLASGTQVGAIAYAAATVTAGTPTTVLQYGGNQNLATNSTSRPIVVQVLDSNGHPMSGVAVTFTTTSTTSTLVSNNVATQSNGYALTYLNAGSVAGPVQVTATAGSKTVGFTLNVGAATGGGTTNSLTIVSGQGQILPGGDSTVVTNTPLVVQVTDPSGAPVSGVNVTFVVAQGPGTVFEEGGGGSSLSSTTDSDGMASINFSSQPVLDTVDAFTQTQVVASAPGTNTVSFYLTAVLQQTFGPEFNVRQEQPAPGAVLTGQAGQVLSGALQIDVASITSIGIPNISVILDDGGVDPTRFASATCNNPNGAGVVSNSSGTITCDIQLGPVVGTVNVHAVVGDEVALSPFTINVKAGPAGVVNIVQGNNQSGLPGQILPNALKIQVTDSAGNILAGQPVQWQAVPSGSITLTNVAKVTDSNGDATATATLPSTPGTYQVQAVAGTAMATFSLSAVVPSAGIVSVSGNNQTAVVNTAFGAPLVVQVVDANGNGVQGVQVNFQVTAGAATLGSASATTVANGQASTTVQAGATPGAITVTATSASFTATFNLTARLPGPTNLAIVNGASFDKTTGISPGGIAIITGTGILPGVQGLVTANNIVGPLPTMLPATNGASVAFGTSLIPAPIYYVMNENGTEQVAIQVPFEIPPGPVTITVTAAGGGSSPLIAIVEPFAPGVFTTTSTGSQPLAVAVRPDGSFVSANNPAQQGENITVYVTGLGAVTPAAATGDAGVQGEMQNVQASMIIGLNNSGVPLVSAVYAPGMVGVYAITLTVPSGTTAGPSQPLGVIVFDSQNNAYFAQPTYLPIQ